MHTLQFLMSVCGIACLISLCLYVYFLFTNHWVAYAAFNNDTIKGKAGFLITASVSLAAIGVFIIVFEGADGLFQWLPENWGSYGENGTFSSYRKSIAGFLACGFCFFVFTMAREYIDTKRKSDYADIIAAEWEKILRAVGNKQSLNDLQNNYAEHISGLKGNYGGPAKGTAGYEHSPGYRRLKAYSQLQWHVSRLLEQA